jgi:ABC-2 type transport system permease protein
MSDGIALTWVQFRLERRMFWRNPAAAFFSFILPLFFLALLGAVFSGSQHDLDLVIPSIAGMSVMATTFTALATQLPTLREAGVLKRMRGTPLPSGSYLGGLFLSAITNAIVQIVITVVAGRLVFGIGWPANWGTLVLFTVAGVLCMAALGVAYAHVIPNRDAAPAFTNFVFLPVVLISAVAHDVDNAPAVLTDIARALPLTHIIDGLAGAMVGGQSAGENAGALGVIALWTVFGLVLAVRGFSWEQKRA